MLTAFQEFSPGEAAVAAREVVILGRVDPVDHVSSHVKGDL
jgi:hypothetical protein